VSSAATTSTTVTLRVPDPSAASARPSSASGRKHRAIHDAAEDLFLAHGYPGTSMDDVAARAQVSKQTVYAHFGNKEALFVALVSTMTWSAGDAVHPTRPGAPGGRVNGAADVLALRRSDVPAFLQEYAQRQLEVVLTPRLMQLRRLVIGEVARFPDLAAALHDAGPARAMTELSAVMAGLAARSLLRPGAAETAASTFNWLVMGGPVNDAMLLGDAAIPGADAQRDHAAEAVRVFLAAYGS